MHCVWKIRWAFGWGDFAALPERMGYITSWCLVMTEGEGEEKVGEGWVMRK